MRTWMRRERQREKEEKISSEFQDCVTICPFNNSSIAISNLRSPATNHMHETVDAHLNIMPVRSFSLNLCNLFCICLSLCWSLSLSLPLGRGVVESEMYLNWVTNDSNLCKRSKNGLLMPSLHTTSWQLLFFFFRRWFHNRTCIDKQKIFVYFLIAHATF